MSTQEDVWVYMELTGQLKFFRNRINSSHLRIGQAFFNSLEEDDQELNVAINTTPLVDVMLVMLIIFLVTIPVIVKTVPVQLPTYRNIVTQTKPENIVISVDKDENIYYNNQPIDRTTMRENFVKALKAAYDAHLANATATAN